MYCSQKEKVHNPDFYLPEAFMKAFATFMFLVGALFLSTHSIFAAVQDAKHFVVDIVTINGEEYVVKDEWGAQGKIHVGTDTEKFGHVQPGDRIDAWVLPNGHARTIMIVRSASIIKQDLDNQNQAQGQRQTEAQPVPEPSGR